MAGGAIAAAIIGIAGSAAMTAANIAASTIQNAKGNKNLATSIEVWNGTEYKLIPVRTDFRAGALFSGIEGEFIRSPTTIDPRQIGVFSVNQKLGATTDVIGSVVYQSDIFDLWVGFHIYDQAGIQRYVFSGLFPKNHLKNTMDGWGADLDQTPNSYIWSGAAPKKSKFSSQGITAGFGLKVNGKFKQGIVKKKDDGTYDTNKDGEPILFHSDAEGDGTKIEFSTHGSGGGETMNVYVFDGPDLYKGKLDDSVTVRLSNVA